ncbi:MAG: hypothetical protein RR867_07885 [Ruthenibacterium sp.]
MLELSDIYAALDAQQAEIFVYDIGFTSAATIEMNDRYAVFFDPALCRTAAALKLCLAHECGHCATGATHRLASKWDIISRHEYKADRWAIERFLPFDALCDAIQIGYCEAWQLAEYFDVPQIFIEKALCHYLQHKNLHFDGTSN